MYAKIYLNYFKQGDDMADCLEQTNGNIVEALRLRVKECKWTIEHLNGIADIIEKTGKVSEFSINASTHHISIEGPEETVQELINKELAYKDDEFNEGDCDDEFDEEFEEF